MAVPPSATDPHTDPKTARDARGTDDAWTTRRLVRWMTERFEASGVEPPRLVAELLLGHVLECERMRLYMEADRPASAEELTRLRDLVKQASAGMPVQYLVGTAHFHGRDFLVDDSTLIPQPCTEELVAQAIRFLRPERASVFDRFDLQRMDRMLEELAGDATATAATADADPADAPDDEVSATPPGPRIADIGTGSGCVGLSIACSVPGSQVVLTDIAAEPLDLARRNAERFDLTDRVTLRQGDGCEPLAELVERDGPFDVIVSNPPYIPDTEWDGGLVEASVRDHVPARALRGGEQGLDVIRPLMRAAPQSLRPGGLFAMECAAAHADTVLEWASIHPRLEAPQLLEDEDGQPRILVARRPDA